MSDDVTGDLSTVDAALLEQWAFGRQGSVADRELAEAALLELSRRAEAARADAVDTGVVPASTDAHLSVHLPDDESDAEPEPARRRRLTRLAVALALGILAIAVLATILLVTMPRESSSLDVFDRAETEAEAQIRQQLQAVGQRVNVGPRVLGGDDLSTIVAYRSSTSDGGTVDRVCLALLEVAGVGDWRCVNESDFEAQGSEFTLYGVAGIVTVEWGPTGPPLVSYPDALDVGRVGGTGEIGDYRDALLREQTMDDRAVGIAIGAAGITPAHGPVIVVTLDTLHGTERVEPSAAGLGVIAAWSAVAPDPQTGVVVCLGIIDLPPADESGNRSSPGTMRETKCVDDERMTGDGLRFDVPTGRGMAVFLWNNELGLRASVVDV